MTVPAAEEDAPLVLIRPGLGISPCAGGATCHSYFEQMQKSLVGRYIGASGPFEGQIIAARIPVAGATLESLRSRTNQFSRRAARKAVRGGYEVRAMDPMEHLEGIVEVNHSLEERCGKPMTDAYRRSLEELRNEAEGSIKFASPMCGRHWDLWRGVFAREGNGLCGYARLRRNGDYMLYGQWLGHGDHLEHGIMHLLHHDILEWVTDTGSSEVKGLANLVYAAWHSGGAGLQYWKRASGFEPVRLILDPADKRP